MFYGIACGAVDTAPYEIEQVLEDIETLNRMALAGELEVSAVSIHAYAHLTERYALMPCGASMGDGYGPRIVARSDMTVDVLRHKNFAVPGTMTSAFMALRLFLGQEFSYDVLRFDQILDVVRNGDADAGLIIHEGQLTYADHDLELLADLGAWWAEQNDGLPLPLGGNVVRKDLGAEGMQRLTQILRESIDYGLQNRGQALDYAMDFGRGLDRDLTDRFVGMYVNDLTRDYGDRGRRAIERFLEQGRNAGITPNFAAVEFVG